MEERRVPIRPDRLVREFMELVSIDSVSFRERKMADALTEKLRQLGMTVREDDSASAYGSQAGNLYGCLPGSLEGPPLLFSAHMDTVEPGIGKRAVLQEDGTITSAGNTVLGSDDVAGIVGILEAVRALDENGIPRRSVEVLFPFAEEAYAMGSSLFDYRTIRAKEAYVLDLSGPVGLASLQEPTLISFTVQVEGKAAHAGFAPQEGVHAIAVAAQAIAGLRQGRVDEETTVNIGKITGGQATNIVPGQVLLEGEVRSYCHEKALAQTANIREAFEAAGRDHGARIEMKEEIKIRAYRVDEQEPVVRRFLQVCDRLGIPGGLTRTLGGSDNNVFVRNGIRGIVLACGMNQVHSAAEYTTVEELTRCAAIVAELMRS